MTEKEEKVPFWSYSPRRGFVYFLAGLVATPIHGLFYWSSWQEFFLITLAMAIIVGLAGTFTDRIDF
jgi:hypothetical protein